jgi:H+/Cl- antiporter ClcA
MRLVLWGGALAVGGISVAFAWAANRAQDLFTHLLFARWFALILTPATFVASAFLARTLFSGSQGSGIPQAIAARHLRDDAKRMQLLSFRLTAGKILFTLLGLAGGASIGREGPTVQVGASLMLGTAKLAGLTRGRGLILASASAGLAAAFNTPLAGIVFAIEEMSRAFESRTTGMVLIAVILAGLVSLGMVGNYSYFGHSCAMLTVTIDWLALPLIGVAGGLAGSLFAIIMVRGTALIRRLLANAPLWHGLALAFACGLCVALCGLLSNGSTYGTGYDAARGAVEGHAPALAFAPLKFLATAASSLSGIPGGLFAPSLAVGAGLGGTIGQLLHVHALGATVLLGMAAFFAAVVQAPITAFVIIEEMSNATGMVIPLMIAAMIGYGISRAMQRPSLYHALARHFLADIAEK